MALAKALINRPEVLLLDEPTASLDPDTGDLVRTWLERYRAESGCTILLASHNMAEVERLCDHVLMMKRGRIVDRGSPAELLARYGRDDLEEVFLDIARDRRAGARGMIRAVAAAHLGADVPPPGAVPPVLAAAAGAGLLADAADVHLGLHRQLLRHPAWAAPGRWPSACCWAACCCGRSRCAARWGWRSRFLEEIWSRNLGHVFVSPLRPWELVAALIAHVGGAHGCWACCRRCCWPGRCMPSTCSRSARC